MFVDYCKATQLCGVLGLVPPAAAAEGAGDYGASLSQVYSAHQRLLALREACDQALPKQKPVNARAYAAWQARHKALLDELDARLTLMIRGASANEQEYMRNVGKYEGAILGERRDYRDQFAAQPRDEVERLCRDFPKYLASPGADFHKEYAEELHTLRQRKLPK